MKEDNKNNHYEDLIKRAKKALDGDDLNQIKLLSSELLTELTMPYVSPKYRKQILELQEKTAAKLIVDGLKNDDLDDVVREKKKMSSKAIKEQLLAPIDVDLLTIAINSLAQLNIGLFIKEINSFLLEENENYHIQKTLLLQELAEQRQFGSYEVTKNNKIFNVEIDVQFNVYEKDLLEVMERIDATQGFDDQVKNIAMNMTSLHWMEVYPSKESIKEKDKFVEVILRIAKSSLESDLAEDDDVLKNIKIN